MEGSICMNINIRNARESDYNQVEAIMEQVQAMHTTWRPDIYKSVDVVLPYDMYMDYVTNNELIVATTEEKKVVAILIYLTLYISGGPMRERKVMFIDSMAVDEKYRGQGLGHKLFNYVRNICEEQKYDGLELQVNAKNIAAKEMYEKYGFTEKSINMELLNLGR